MLYNHINAHDYKECQDDIQSVSAIADDIREAVTGLSSKWIQSLHRRCVTQIERNTLADGPAEGNI